MHATIRLQFGIRREAADVGDVGDDGAGNCRTHTLDALEDLGVDIEVLHGHRKCLRHTLLLLHQRIEHSAVGDEVLRDLLELPLRVEPLFGAEDLADRAHAHTMCTGDAIALRVAPIVDLDPHLDEIEIALLHFVEQRRLVTKQICEQKCVVSLEPFPALVLEQEGRNSMDFGADNLGLARECVGKVVTGTAEHHADEVALRKAVERRGHFGDGLQLTFLRPDAVGGNAGRVFAFLQAAPLDVVSGEGQQIVAFRHVAERRSEATVQEIEFILLGFERVERRLVAVAHDRNEGRARLFVSRFLDAVLDTDVAHYVLQNGPEGPVAVSKSISTGISASSRRTQSADIEGQSDCRAKAHCFVRPSFEHSMFEDSKEGVRHLSNRLATSSISSHPCLEQR